MLDKLGAINDRYKEVEKLISSPDAMNVMKLYVQLSKEYKDLEPIVKAYKEYRDLVGNIIEAKEILSNSDDAEMKEIANIELDANLPRKEEMDEKIKVLLIPQDDTDAKNAVMEIRAGTGGDEASIFAGDLYRMYTAFASVKGWKTELVDVADGTAGGYKEIIFNITGEDVYGQLKFESGVHRVQRVPKTETQGRVHTSAASVIVLPEAEEFDIELKPSDIRKDTYCSSGPG
jgi:peptide chain release factor 1